jgi:DNA ligase-1
MSRDFLMLAKPFNPEKDRLAGKYISEKLDGSRVFWDGGLSRNALIDSVPWANLTDPKTGNRKPNLPERATGLWSRYGNPVFAPDWWLNQLPACPLDGELWAGRGNFQTLRSIVARNNPDERWRDVQFAVFSSPPLSQIFGSGLVKNTNFVRNFDADAIKSFCMGRMDAGFGEDFKSLIGPTPFDQELTFLSSLIPSEGSSVLYLHRQVQLPKDEGMAALAVQRIIGDVLDEGGEGVMIRDPQAVWTPKRVGTLLKWKPFNDDAGTLVGFTTGRKTEKGSKLLGLIGALILDYKGQPLELSGMTDLERKFATQEMEQWAVEHPGVEAPAGFQGRSFKLGDVVEFRYRELSDKGVPKEARLLRKCEGSE